MIWIKKAIAMYKSGEEWDAILADQSVEQIKLLITLAEQMSPDSVVSFFEYLSRYPDPTVREAVGKALSQWSYEEALRVLMPLLTDEWAEVRVAATVSLGRMKAYNVVPLLERMARDDSRLVRMAASQALLQLKEVSPLDTLSVGMNLIQDTDPIVACNALYAISKLRSTEIRVFASGVVRAVKRYHPTLTQAAKIDYHHAAAEAADLGYSSPDLYLESQPINRNQVYITLGDVAEPQFHTVLRNVNERIQTKRPRQLYGWWTGMLKDGAWSPGEPPFISCLEGYKYQFSVALSPESISSAERVRVVSGESNLEGIFQGTDTEHVTLAVAILPDNELLAVEGISQVKPLRLPREGAGDIVSFTFRGVNEGETSLQILIYYLGCLILRAITLPIKIKAQPGVVSGVDQIPAAATLLDQQEDLSTTASHLKQERRGSLLIDRHGDKYTFVLFYEGDGDYQLRYARVPVRSVEVDFHHLRKKLRELVEMRGGFWGRRSVFMRNSFDLRITPEDAQKALKVIREAGQELWYNLFSDPSAEPLREQLLSLLSTDSERNILQIVSDDLFLPWQILYLDDGEPVAKANLFWGLRFQIEQTLGVGVGLKSLQTESYNGPIIAYINKYLPGPTLKEHFALFPYGKFTEGDVLDDFKRSSDLHPAFYFYCHAKYNVADRLESWIKLTDDRSKLTLRVLQKTSLDPKTQKQVEFQSSPLVFLNACESGQVESSFYQSLVGFLLTKKKAGGVVGTETEMPAFFATSFAKQFWESVSAEPSSVGQILFDLRKQIWEDFNNPLGLLYSLYSNSELQIAIQGNSGRLI